MCVDARRLITETMDLYLEGSAWFAVHVNRKLNVRVAGNGEVVYFGNLALLNQYIFGKGKVEKGISEND
ncbi:GIN domain-containing protein [Coxiella-like endosymbiont]|uniref:GIN domain-containing protein n=1 Tax=Coxiella-like endosymbiont TaxID=1592897 RepID=UPI00272964EA|nr:DUF2807 domain-containing protein [Coxiella-like endosymbiont]